MDKKTLTRILLALIKNLGEDIENFYCMDCLAEYLGCTVDELLEKIEEFKEEGCKLFE